MCCRACQRQAGSSTEVNAALQAISISLAKQMLQSGLLQALPNVLRKAGARLQAVASKRGTNGGGVSSSSSSRQVGGSRTGASVETPPLAAAAGAAPADAPLAECTAQLEFLTELLLAWPGNPWTSAALVDTMEPACSLVVAVMRHGANRIQPSQQQDHGQQQGQQQEQEQPCTPLAAAHVTERQAAKLALKFCVCLAYAAPTKPLQAPLVTPLQQLALTHGLMPVVVLLLAAYGHALEGFVSAAGACSTNCCNNNAASISGTSSGSTSNGGSTPFLPAPPSVLSPFLSQQLQEQWSITPECVAVASRVLDWHMPDMWTWSPRKVCTAAIKLCQLQCVISHPVLQSMAHRGLQRAVSSHMLVMLLTQNVMAATAALQLQPRVISRLGGSRRGTGGSSTGSNAAGANSSTSVSVTTTGASSGSSRCDAAGASTSTVGVTTAGATIVSGSSSSTAIATVSVAHAPQLIESDWLWSAFSASFRVWGNAAVLDKQLMGHMAGSTPARPAHVRQQQQQQKAALVPVAVGSEFIPTHHCSVSFSQKARKLLLQSSKWLLTEVLLRIRLLPEGPESRGSSTKEAKELKQALERACHTLVFCASSSSAPCHSDAEQEAAAKHWASHTAELAGLLQAVARQLPGLIKARPPPAAAAAAVAGCAASKGGDNEVLDCCALMAESVLWLYLGSYADQPRDSTCWAGGEPAGGRSQQPGTFLDLAAVAAATIAGGGGSSAAAAVGGQKASPAAAASLANLHEMTGLMLSLSKLAGSNSNCNSSSTGDKGSECAVTAAASSSSQSEGPLNTVHRHNHNLYVSFQIAWAAVSFLCACGTTAVAVCERPSMFGPSASAADTCTVRPKGKAVAAAAAEGKCTSIATSQLGSDAAEGAQLVPWAVLIGRRLLQMAQILREWLAVPTSSWWSAKRKESNEAAAGMLAALDYWRQMSSSVEKLFSDMLNVLGPGAADQQHQKQQQQPFRQLQPSAAAPASASARVGNTAPQLRLSEDPLSAVGPLLASQLGGIGLEAQLQVCLQALAQLQVAHAAAQSSYALLPPHLEDAPCTSDDLLAAERDLLRKFGIPEDVRQRVLAAAQAALAAGQPYVLHQMMVGAWQGCPKVSALVEALEGLGAALTSLPTSQACNNPRCTNMASPSELMLVGGSSCVCGGCKVARYCGRSCQLAHWQQHKPVCRVVAAAAVRAASAPAAAEGSRAAAPKLKAGSGAETRLVGYLFRLCRW